MKTIAFPTLPKGHVNNGNVVWKICQAAGYTMGSNGWVSVPIQQLVETGYEIATITLQELGLEGPGVTPNQVQEKVVAMGWEFFCPFTHYSDQNPGWVAIVSTFKEIHYLPNPNRLNRDQVDPKRTYDWKKEESAMIFRKVVQASVVQGDEKGSEVVTA